MNGWCIEINSWDSIFAMSVVRFVCGNVCDDRCRSGGIGTVEYR